MADERKLPPEHQALADRAKRAGDGLYARVGECVTCEGGHPICRIAVDISIGALHDDEQFDSWTQPVPVAGRPGKDYPCIICGKLWFSGDKLTGIGALHFKEGWR